MNFKLFFEAFLKFLLGVILVGVLIFLPAGTIYYFNGWLLMVLLFIPMFVAGIIMMIKSPNLLKERLGNDKTKETYYSYVYLHQFLQSMETNDELKYILAYMSKSLGFVDPMEFYFNKDKQFIFESIMFSAMTLYNNGGASRNKLGESHKRFVQSIEQKKEDKLSRTQELNTVKIQALKELNYSEINEDNAKEVFEKIAEIQSRKV